MKLGFFLVAAVFSAAFCLVMGCEADPEFDQFRVRVVGLRTAHDTFPLKVDGYEVTENFYFEGAFVRELNFQKPLAELDVPIVVRSEFEDETIDQVTVQPFLCKEMKRDPDIGNWNFIEQFDLKVTNEGELRKNEDLDRNLAYTCNASSPSGEDAEGVGQSWSSLELCVEPDRAGTNVVLSIGQSEPMNPEACWSSYGQSRGGILTVGFRFPLALAGSRMISLQFSTVDFGVFDKGPEGDSAIAELPIPYLWSDFQNTTSHADLTLYRGGEPRESVTPISGTWTLQSLTWGESPRMTGDFVFEFELNELGRIQVSGSIDLPIHRSRF